METTLRLPGRSEVSRNEHNQILSAIESGNGELASRLTLQHISGARKTALIDAKKRENNKLKVPFALELNHHPRTMFVVQEQKHFRLRYRQVLNRLPYGIVKVIIAYRLI
jgi:hypothetical protein